MSANWRGVIFNHLVAPRSERICMQNCPLSPASTGSGATAYISCSIYGRGFVAVFIITLPLLDLYFAFAARCMRGVFETLPASIAWNAAIAAARSAACSGPRSRNSPERMLII